MVCFDICFDGVLHFLNWTIENILSKLITIVTITILIVILVA